MLPGGSHTICIIQDMFPGLDLYHTDPAQHLITAGEDLDDLYDLSDISDLSDVYTLLHQLLYQHYFNGGTVSTRRLKTKKRNEAAKKAA